MINELMSSRIALHKDISRIRSIHIDALTGDTRKYDSYHDIIVGYTDYNKNITEMDKLNGKVDEPSLLTLRPVKGSNSLFFWLDAINAHTFIDSIIRLNETSEFMVYDFNGNILDNIDKSLLNESSIVHSFYHDNIDIESILLMLQEQIHLISVIKECSAMKDMTERITSKTFVFIGLLNYISKLHNNEYNKKASDLLNRVREMGFNVIIIDSPLLVDESLFDLKNYDVVVNGNFNIDSTGFISYSCELNNKSNNYSNKITDVRMPLFVTTVVKDSDVVDQLAALVEKGKTSYTEIVEVDKTIPEPYVSASADEEGVL